MTAFSQLSKIDCSAHVERKGKFSYLSWPWAVKMLREQAPDATWQVIRFDGLPYLKTDAGHFVEVAVTVDGITLSQIHPVLNAQNRTIAEPNAFDINTSIQRALVKAIALHGLGLYIYAGEDLPEAPDAVELTEEQIAADMDALQRLRDASLDGMEPLKLEWRALDELTRERLKAELPALKQAAAAIEKETANA